MRKLIFCFSLLLFLPASAFASTQTDFLNAIVKTFQEDFTLTGGNTFDAFLNKKSVLNISTEDEVLRKDFDWEGHREMNGRFDLLPIAEFFGEDIPELTGEVKMGSDFYYQKEEAIFQARLRDFQVMITSEDSRYKDIVEGFLEFLQIFQSQYMVIDIPAILDAIADYNMQDMEFLKSQLTYLQKSFDTPGETAEDIFKILLDSGFLQISKVSSQFVIELQQDPQNIHPEKLADIFLYFGMDEEMVAEIADELEYKTESIRDSWQDVLDMLNLSIRFSYSAGEITFFEADFSAAIEQVIPEWDYETFEVISEKTMLLEFAINSKFLVKDESDRIVFPKEEPSISFATIIRGLGAMMDFGM